MAAQNMKHKRKTNICKLKKIFYLTFASKEVNQIIATL